MELKPRHFECIRLMLETQKTQREIATLIGVNDETVYRWNKDDDFKAELARQTQNKFNAMATKAVKELDRLINEAASETVRLNAIKDVLDRAGYKPIEKQEIKHEGLQIEIDYGDGDES